MAKGYIAYRLLGRHPERRDWPRCSACGQYLDRVGTGNPYSDPPGRYECPETQCERYGAR